MILLEEENSNFQIQKKHVSYFMRIWYYTENKF